MEIEIWIIGCLEKLGNSGIESQPIKNHTLRYGEFESSNGERKGTIAWWYSSLLERNIGFKSVNWPMES